MTDSDRVLGLTQVGECISLVVHLNGAECYGLGHRPNWHLHVVHCLLCGVIYDVRL